MPTTPKLTAPRAEALRAVAAGTVVVIHPIRGAGGGHSTFYVDGKQATQAPYRWLNEHELLRVEATGWGSHRAEVTITDAGREALEALAPKVYRASGALVSYEL